MPPSREARIENAIIENPGALGFPTARAIRRCRIGEPCGLVDVVLLPRSRSVDLVLIEAKATGATDATSKVVGQLLMYYAGALTLGSEGLRSLRRYARDHVFDARGLRKISPKALTGGLSPPHLAWEALRAGTPMSPRRVQLYVGLDGAPRPALLEVISVLRKHHGLSIGYFVVHRGSIKYVEPAALPA